MELYSQMTHAHESLYQAYAQEKYRCKTWKSGKSHLSSDHCENGPSRKIVLLCIVRNLASPFKTPMKLYSHMAHAHGSLYQAYAPEKYRRKTWKSGKSHLERGSLWKRHSRKIVLVCIVRNLASPFETPMKPYSHMAHAHVSLYQAYAPEKYRRKTWKSGKSYLERGSLWKRTFSKDCTTLHRQKSRKPFKDAHETLHQMAHAHGSLYQT